MQIPRHFLARIMSAIEPSYGVMYEASYPSTSEKVVPVAWGDYPHWPSSRSMREAGPRRRSCARIAVSTAQAGWTSTRGYCRIFDVP